MAIKYNLVALIRLMVLAFCLFNTSWAQEKLTSPSGTSEERWLNASIFDASLHKNGSLYNFNFDIEFTSPENEIFTVNDCLDVKSIGAAEIAPREYTRWDFLNVDCEVVNRFYLAPEKAITFWPAMFDFSLLKSFPATAIPYLGGQGLDNRQEDLHHAEPTLKLIESKEDNIKVSFDGMVVNYVMAARADFNRDGYQDLFVRMDWSIKEAFGDGHDWVVLTKTSSHEAPMILWRK